MVLGPKGVMVQGGFSVLETVPGQCQVVHYERYELSMLYFPLLPMIRLYLRKSLHRELLSLRRAIERAGGSSC
jgi:hypothetical protein